MTSVSNSASENTAGFNIPPGCRLLIPFSYDDMTWGDIHILSEVGMRAGLGGSDPVEFVCHEGSGIVTDIAIDG